VTNMAKARARTAVRKTKDRWKTKSWYNVIAPPSFDNVTVADALADSPHSLINRVTEVSLQDLTNDFRKSHIKLYFKIHKVEETNAHTQFVGHTLTSDYLRRMVRRRRSKIEGVYDVTTQDGATIRVKPFATTDKRIQRSQKKIVREAMKKTLYDQAKTSTLAEFVKDILDGKMGGEIYKNCRKLYPVKRVEIYKTELISPPTVKVDEKKTVKKEEVEEVKEAEKKKKKTTKKAEKKEVAEEKPKEKPKKEKKPAAKETAKKPKKKEKPKAKKPAKKSTKTITEKKATTKKKTTKKEEK